jgi:hypothetical protein
MAVTANFSNLEVYEISSPPPPTPTGTPTSQPTATPGN